MYNTFTHAHTAYVPYTHVYTAYFPPEYTLHTLRMPHAFTCHDSHSHTHTHTHTHTYTYTYTYTYTHTLHHIMHTNTHSLTHTYRGLMLDTARHFQPLPSMKKLLDAMSYAKLNVLHWHAIDSQSFPMESKRYPKLWNGAWYV
jgi:Glycosyl hydrolase family 20, catalytic domain